MQELVKIQRTTKGENVVSARELHSFLEVKTEFYHWCNRMLGYGFEEGVDFNFVEFDEVRLEGKRQVKRQITDYALTLDTAKQICMLQKTEKGRQARLYFIECEKRLYQTRELSRKELAMMVIQIEEEKEKLLLEKQELEHTVSILTHVNKTYTTTEIAKELGLKSANVLNAILEEKKIQYKQNSTWVLYSKYADKGYKVESS
jgi:anti-repressor protein